MLLLAPIVDCKPLNWDWAWEDPGFPLGEAAAETNTDPDVIVFIVNA
jgi:hypothetical protein